MIFGIVEAVLFGGAMLAIGMWATAPRKRGKEAAGLGRGSIRVQERMK